MEKIKLKSAGRKGTISRSIIRAVVRKFILPRPIRKARHEAQK
jgi:hypothetical protein